MISALAMQPGSHSTTTFSRGGQRVGATMRAPAGLMFSVIALSNGPGLVRLVSQIGTFRGDRFSVLPLCRSMGLYFPFVSLLWLWVHQRASGCRGRVCFDTCCGPLG